MEKVACENERPRYRERKKEKKSEREREREKEKRESERVCMIALKEHVKPNDRGSVRVVVCALCEGIHGLRLYEMILCMHYFLERFVSVDSVWKNAIAVEMVECGWTSLRDDKKKYVIRASHLRE